MTINELKESLRDFIKELDKIENQDASVIPTDLDGLKYLGLPTMRLKIKNQGYVVYDNSEGKGCTKFVEASLQKKRDIIKKFLNIAIKANDQEKIQEYTQKLQHTNDEVEKLYINDAIKIGLDIRHPSEVEMLALRDYDNKVEKEIVAKKDGKTVLAWKNSDVMEAPIAKSYTATTTSSGGAKLELENQSFELPLHKHEFTINKEMLKEVVREVIQEQEDKIDISKITQGINKIIKELKDI